MFFASRTDTREAVTSLSMTSHICYLSTVICRSLRWSNLPLVWPMVTCKYLYVKGDEKNVLRHCNAYFVALDANINDVTNRSIIKSLLSSRSLFQLSPSYRLFRLHICLLPKTSWTKPTQPLMTKRRKRWKRPRNFGPTACFDFPKGQSNENCRSSLFQLICQRTTKAHENLISSKPVASVYQGLQRSKPDTSDKHIVRVS